MSQFDGLVQYCSNSIANWSYCNLALSHRNGNKRCITIHEEQTKAMYYLFIQLISPLIDFLVNHNLVPYLFVLFVDNTHSKLSIA